MDAVIRILILIILIFICMYILILMLMLILIQGKSEDEVKALVASWLDSAAIKGHHVAATASLCGPKGRQAPKDASASSCTSEGYREQLRQASSLGRQAAKYKQVGGALGGRQGGVQRGAKRKNCQSRVPTLLLLCTM